MIRWLSQLSVAMDWALSFSVDLAQTRTFPALVNLVQRSFRLFQNALQFLEERHPLRDRLSLVHLFGHFEEFVLKLIEFLVRHGRLSALPFHASCQIQAIHEQPDYKSGKYYREDVNEVHQRSC